MKLRYILLMSGAISGCASMTHGPKQRVMVSTPGAPQAQCTLSSQSLGVRHFTTPEAVEIPRSSEAIEVSCRKKCFYEETRTFAPVMNGEDLASNGFFGGAGPLAIDLATKKAYNYNYDFVIQLKPDHRCRSKWKGYLDGNPKDFDNRIDDFTFDESPRPLPDSSVKESDTKTAPISSEKGK